MTYTIKIEDIEILVEKKKIKHMYLKVDKNGKVKISAPHSIRKEEIISFCESKLDWIKLKQIEILKNNHSRKIKKLKYINGETLYLWGKQYTLQLIEKNKNYKKAFADKKTIYLPVDKDSKIKKREKVILEFYRKEIKNEIEILLDECVKTVGKKPDEWRVKNMKTRWGTCNVKDKRIWLNLQLAKTPKECLRYVIIHELTHLYIANHGKEFQNLMDEFYPNWKEIKEILKNNKYD